MDEKYQELLRELQACKLAAETITKSAGIPHWTGGGTYLVSEFRRREDLPLTASLRRMSNKVTKNLAEAGLREPVSLQSVPNFWWQVKVDAAEAGLISEYGNSFVRRILSTGELMFHGMEVDDGPFSAWENKDVSRAILNKHPNKFWDARIYQMTATRDRDIKPHFSGVDDGYTSEALMAALDQGGSIQVFSGPYETEIDAKYALDIRWEVPN